MPRPLAPPGFLMVCQNVQGLTGLKLLQLLSWFSEHQVDIAILTETQTTSDPEDLLRRTPGAGTIWPGATFFFCPGNGHTQGVCIIMGPSMQLCSPVLFPLTMTQGRLLRVDFTLVDTVVSLVAVYCPTTPTLRAAFFADHLRSALPQDGRHLILGGDFNCVTSVHDCIYRPGCSAPNPNTRLQGALELMAVMADKSLEDVLLNRSQGTTRPFTHWSSMHQSGARLDRWLVSTSLLSLFTATSKVLSAPGTKTDHLPVQLLLKSMSQDFPKGRGVQGFPLMALNIPAARQEIADYMETATEALMASPSQGFVARWNNLKEALRQRSCSTYKKHRKQRQREARLADQLAHDAQLRVMSASPLENFEVLCNSAAYLRTKATEAWNTLSAESMSSAALLDQLQGDTSSYYFHHMAKKPHPTSSIQVLHKPHRSHGDDPAPADLRSASGHNLGLHYCFQHYSGSAPSGLFRARSDIDLEAQHTMLSSLTRKLSPDAAALAEGPDGESLISSQELELALQLSNRGSAPGIDGLPYEFYRAFSALLAPVLLRVFNVAYQDLEDAQPLQPLLLGVICLVLKSDNPTEELSSYRPITLLNCDIKLLMLILSNRLQRPLDYLIDITQSAFLRGRDISDNVRYHMGLTARLQELGIPGWLLMSDLTKAYDTVDRGWLLSCMHAMGFRQLGIVRWCRILLAGTRAQVRLNGHFSAPFATDGGLPQGGSLSCQEWDIVFQPHLSYLNSLQSSGRLHHVQLPNDMPAPAALAFADDLESFVGDPDSDAPVLKEASDLAYKAGLPRQHTGKTKLLHLSGAVPPSCSYAHDSSYHAPSGYGLLPVGKPYRLLGVPLGASEELCSKAAYAQLAHNMRRAGAPWSSLRINLLGRGHVAMQCLASKAIYQANFWMPSPIHLPAMQQAINQFVGSSDLIEEETPFQGRLFPRFDICKLPLSRGGIGLPSLRSHILAMQAKTAWLLFRFSAHPWQPLYRDAFSQLTLPSAGRPPGYHTLITNPRAIEPARSSNPLVRSSAAAFLHLRVHRILSLDAQDNASVLLELTFLNDNDGTVEPVPPSSMVSSTALLWYRLKDVRSAFLQQDHLSLDARLDLAHILHSLPVPWRNVVTCPQLPPATWTSFSQDVEPGPRIFEGPDPTSDEIRLWELWPSGRLHPLLADHPRPLGPPIPALVALQPKPKTEWTTTDASYMQVQSHLPLQDQRPLMEPWLIDLLPRLQLDPRVWGLHLPDDGTASLLELTVRHARQRIAHTLQQLSTGSTHVHGYAEESAAWPKAWQASLTDDDPTAPSHLRGLPGIEDRWCSAASLPATHPAPPDMLDWIPPWLDLARSPPLALAPKTEQRDANTRPVADRPAPSCAPALLQSGNACWTLLSIGPSGSRVGGFSMGLWVAKPSFTTYAAPLLLTSTRALLLALLATTPIASP